MLLKTMIISAFLGCGKTYLYRNQEKFNYKIIDSESTKFKKCDGWEKEYVDYIVLNIGKYDFIFVSKHPVVLQELNNRNIPFIMVSPDNSSSLSDKERQLIKQQWFGRFILRDNSHIKDFNKWIKRQIENYDERTSYEHLTLYKPIKVILLKENEYLSDKIDKLYIEKEQ